MALGVANNTSKSEIGGIFMRSKFSPLWSKWHSNIFTVSKKESRRISAFKCAVISGRLCIGPEMKRILRSKVNFFTVWGVYDSNRLSSRFWSLLERIYKVKILQTSFIHILIPCVKVNAILFCNISKSEKFDFSMK